jgi:MFS family permease
MWLRYCSSELHLGERQASVSFIAIGNSMIQLSAEPSMRGRAIALWQVAFQGTTPIGGPAIGWIIAIANPRIGPVVGGASCFVAAFGGVALARRSVGPCRRR